MNILLLNDNPVVTKLVTLSAQKTGSEILIASNMEEIQSGSYDLLIVDEALYTPELMNELKSKIPYKYALYMLSRGAPSVDGFDKEVKKPFLPTDLVELLSSISATVANMKDNNVDISHIGFEEDFDENEDVKNKILNDSSKEDDLNLDDFDFDNINLDDINLEDDEMGSILDHEDVQEVKNLLDEEELETHAQEDELSLEDEFNLDDELNLDDLDLEDAKEETLMQVDELEDDFSFDDLDLLGDFEEESTTETLPSIEENEALILENDLEDEVTLEEPLAKEEILTEDEASFEKEESSFKEKLDLEEETIFEDEVDFEEEPLLEEEVLSEIVQPETEISNDDLSLDELEDKIESAVGELSSEDLDQEIDFSFDDLSELETLDEKSLKIALGEEVDDTTQDELMLDEEEEILADTESEFVEEPLGKEVIEEPKLELETKTDGVEALKALLKALSNEDVVASLKGMNVSINISFGNNSDK